MEILTHRDDSLWYKNAVIYELHVRSFFDSDADGIGDFQGLIEKLDYLEDLGVNTVWLLPFYPSPLKDDGYDIADFTGIHSTYGTMSDFKTFVDEAHRHGLRVITELVANHTSSQHPWFQKSRRAKAGSRLRDIYVWSDTPEKYKDARVIFKDFETSNWTWDHVAKAYYWHRFYSHQPDLNYDNPAVKKAVFKVMDFWLKSGVDGLRVDAVPYLYEREGTSCENLPETHAFIKELRAHIDKKFEYRMLLAEANQWPEDASAYFGTGDEFHMAFNFPIMPRLFMAIRMEDRFPIIDILRQTPAIPDTCQWATFLRNHDELTLEMVTDEERDYMYRTYANDPSARLNLGIRRRLAPLLNNDRKKIELMNALLFSLPGTPVIYYGDEIGMGDNFYLGDRNGVRTPMQWSSERNAGFSQANPQRLYLPPIIDPEYHYEAVNVENQQANTDSLLWWMKRIIALQKSHPAFGRGSIEFLQTNNRKILAFLRHFEDENLLIIANLSRLVQQTQVSLPNFNGWRPVDLFGRVEFIPVSDGAYSFTLGPYSFYWFSLEPQPAETLRERSLPADEKVTVPTINIKVDELFEKNNWYFLENVLQNYIKARRWFRGKARAIHLCNIQDVIPMRAAKSLANILLVRIEYVEGEPETYVLPLAIAPSEIAAKIIADYPHAEVARIKTSHENNDLIIYDGLVDEDYCTLLMRTIEWSRNIKGTKGRLIPSRVRGNRTIRRSDSVNLEPKPVKVEQTNTSVIYGQQYILKLFRCMEDGINPELEIGRFLTEKVAFPHTSSFAGALEYGQGRGKLSTLAILESFVPNEGDAWQYTLDSLDHYFQSVMTHPTVQSPPIPLKHILSLPKEPPLLAKETIGPYLTSAQLLGQRTAELHTALASENEDPDFSPEPFSFMYQTSLYQSMRSFTTRTFQLLHDRLNDIPESLKQDALHALELEKAIIERYQLIRKQKISAVRTRCHGDYHLGQVLYTGKDFVIIDFEGEPARSISERKLKRSPLQDVAGMIRSFHYATHSVLLRQVTLATRAEDDIPVLQQWAQYWYVWVSVSFLNAYLDGINSADLLPKDPEHLKILLNAFLLEKAVYEIGYELNNRPNWLTVPLRSIVQLMDITT